MAEEPATEAADPEPGVRLAESLRRLVDTAVRTRVDDGTIGEVAARADELTDRLAADVRDGAWRPGSEDPLGTDANPFPFNPVVGRSNPYAPPVTFDLEGGELVGHANLGSAYEGPPGHVHGGILCLILDQTLGLANLAAGNPGMTVNLDVDYRRPTPLNTDLRIVSRYVSADGRKIRSRGEIHAGGALTVEAEGLFLAISEEQAAGIFAGVFDDES